MKSWTEYAPCAFCSDNEYLVEPWGDNLYLLKCTNSNTSAAMWCEWKKGRWHKVSVQRPKPKPVDLRGVPITQRALRPDGSVAIGAEAMRIRDAQLRSQARYGRI